MDDLHDICAMCRGPLIFLGTLGKLDHYRCRNCGADQNFPSTNDVEQDDLPTYDDECEPVEGDV